MKKIIWVTCFLLLLSLTIVAQDSEPTPELTVDDYYDWSAKVYFPQEIEFTLLARRRESEIASLDLTITYRGADPFPVSIEPTTLLSTPAGGVYKYGWEIPQADPPILFDRLRYTWDIVTVEGQSFTVTGDLDFVDERVNWEQSNDLQSQVNIYHRVGSLDADAVRSGVRATYDLLFRAADDSPTYTLLIYPQNVPMACNMNADDEPIITIQGSERFADIPCDLELASDIYDHSDLIVLQQTPIDQIWRTLNDLFVTTYYEDQWGDAEVPAWFLRGLQLFYDPRSKIEQLTLGQVSVRADEILSLIELDIRPADEGRQAIWDAQSIGMILYIADKIGVDSLFELADSIADYDTFAEAYEEFVGQPIDVLIVSWQDWLFRPSTQLDYEYNPYLPDTPTPTATRTPTHTPSPTFTPSKTPDITNTPRPTRTPRPPTATITPLPAQSFSVQPTDAPPTPIPAEPDEGFVLDEELATRIAVGGAVIMGLLVLLYLVLRRR